MKYRIRKDINQEYVLEQGIPILWGIWHSWAELGKYPAFDIAKVWLTRYINPIPKTQKFEPVYFNEKGKEISA